MKANCVFLGQDRSSLWGPRPYVLLYKRCTLPNKTTSRNMELLSKGRREEVPEKNVSWFPNLAGLGISLSGVHPTKTHTCRLLNTGITRFYSEVLGSASEKKKEVPMLMRKNMSELWKLLVCTRRAPPQERTYLAPYWKACSTITYVSHF